MTLAAVVLDRQNGHMYSAGPVTSNFGTASVVKLFVATKLLLTGQMTDQTASTAFTMITQSDDASLEALLPMVGGTSVVSWVADHYGIPDLGGPSPKEWCWGNTQITAKGLAEFYRAMMTDRAVYPWLINAMHHYTDYGSDGTPQTFGIPSATTGAGIKQGWGGDCSSNTDGSVLNSTGVIENNRFIVVVLSNTNASYANADAYNAYQADVVTAATRMIMPGGVITEEQ